MNESLFSDIERARLMGAVCLLKWDGERSGGVYTVLINHPATGFSFRADTDDMAAAVLDGLSGLWDSLDGVDV